MRSPSKKSSKQTKNPALRKEVKQLPAKKVHLKKSEPIRIQLKAAKRLKSTIELLKRNLREEPTCSLPYDAKPMLASVAKDPFNHPDWCFEIKWDGYRTLAFLHNGVVQLSSRNNLPLNQKFYPIQEALQQWPVNAVVDGEVVILNEVGRSDFKSLQEWHRTKKGELVYYVFDILWLDGIDITKLPLKERKKILHSIAPDIGCIRISDSIDEYGTDFYEVARKNGLEGIIAKDKNAPYLPGQRSRSWLKIKIEQRHEAVICGYTLNKGSDRLFSSLILGIYEGADLKYIGQVGTGFTQAVQKELMDKMKPLVTPSCPFASLPPTKAATVWIKPWLVCEVKYTELTPDGVMRHPSFQGLREDKTINDLNNELPTTRRTARKRLKQVQKAEPQLVEETADHAVVTVNDQELKLTNLQKLYWIKEKISKGDLLNYYYEIAPFMMPYLKDRPQSLNRFPNGIKGKSFYQKDVGGKVEKWIKTFSRFSASAEEVKDFMICTNEASLLYMVNMGCIELNPWHSRVQSPHYPDWSVIDLDPGNISFDKVIETAIVVKKVLDALRVPSFPKTSGSTGIHIYVPLGAKYNYDQSKQFAELVAHLVHEELPAFTSIVRNPRKRQDKIYIDFLQNRPIQTICAPYSVRPKEGAPVSAPLDWSEVKKGLKMEQFTIHNMASRLKKEGDLFEGVLGQGIDLNKVLKALSSLVTSP